MDKKQLVVTKMKPKVKSFGFTQKELMSAAARIADNLNLEDDATEEEVNAEIDAKITAVIPYLQLSQSIANRVIEDSRKKKEGSSADDDDSIDDDDDSIDDDDDNNADDYRSKNSRKKKVPTPKKQDETPEWAKNIVSTVQQLNNELSALKSEKTVSTRRSKLEGILKDTGTFGTRTLKSFSKMNFENEDDFETFLSDVKDDLKIYNQERADAGLSLMGQPLGGVLGGNKDKKEEPFSDAEIDAMAASI